jgi:hypothetical protein
LFRAFSGWCQKPSLNGICDRIGRIRKLDLCRLGIQKANINCLEMSHIAKMCEEIREASYALHIGLWLLLKKKVFGRQLFPIAECWRPAGSGNRQGSMSGCSYGSVTVKSKKGFRRLKNSTPRLIVESKQPVDNHANRIMDLSIVNVGDYAHHYTRF